MTAFLIYQYQHGHLWIAWWVALVLIVAIFALIGRVGR